MTKESHIRAYQAWLKEFSQYLYAERGRSSRLAEFLDVDRQAISRWFVLNVTHAPDWAVMAARGWYIGQTTCRVVAPKDKEVVS